MLCLAAFALLWIAGPGRYAADSRIARRLCTRPPESHSHAVGTPPRRQTPLRWRILPSGKKNHTVMAPKTKTPDRLTVEERRELPASAFGIPETREFPLVDAAHIRAAEAYFRYAPDDRKAALARRILARAREMGVDVRSRVIRGWAGEA